MPAESLGCVKRSHMPPPLDGLDSACSILSSGKAFLKGRLLMRIITLVSGGEKTLGFFGNLVMWTLLSVSAWCMLLASLHPTHSRLQGRQLLFRSYYLSNSCELHIEMVSLLRAVPSGGVTIFHHRAVIPAE